VVRSYVFLAYSIIVYFYPVIVCPSAEFGDYDPHLHTDGYLQTLKLVSGNLSDELQATITEVHREKLRYLYL